MCWGRKIGHSRQFVQVAVVLALGLLNAGCFQPLYGRQTLSAGESLPGKLAGVEIAPIPAASGSSDARLAVELRNDLIFELNNGAAPVSPTHRLQITLSSGVTTVIVDVTSGRPETQVESVTASFTLTEVATRKVVLSGSTFGDASFDIPGTEQRFAQQRAWRNAEDRAVKLVAQNIRSRLASFFVAGT